MDQTKKRPDIFHRLQSGESIRMDDPEYPKLTEVVDRTLKLTAKMNATGDTGEVRRILSDITGTIIDASTTIFPPFHTNFGRFTRIGKNVFINHACSFLDLGGIIIEDDVLIGPRVNLISENHPLDPADRRSLTAKPVRIKQRAWIGAAATILPGITVGKNAVVAAGSVVTKDVPDNTAVAGVPAKVIKELRP